MNLNMQNSLTITLLFAVLCLQHFGKGSTNPKTGGSTPALSPCALANLKSLDLDCDFPVQVWPKKNLYRLFSIPSSSLCPSHRLSSNRPPVPAQAVFNHLIIFQRLIFEFSCANSPSPIGRDHLFSIHDSTCSMLLPLKLFLRPPCQFLPISYLARCVLHPQTLLLYPPCQFLSFHYFVNPPPRVFVQICQRQRTGQFFLKTSLHLLLTLSTKTPSCLR